MPTRKIIRLKNKTVQKSQPVNQVNKILETNTEASQFYNPTDPNAYNPILERYGMKKRGITVYSSSQLIGATGRDEQGRLMTWGVEQPYFYLTVTQREEMFKICSPVFGIVTTRQNRIASMNFSVVPVKKDEDRIAEELKMKKQLFNEYKDSTLMGDIYLKLRLVNEIRKTLPDCKPDLSNFEPALMRWKKHISFVRTDKGEEIKGWLEKPSPNVKYREYVHKFVHDILVHGAAATYKMRQNNRVENFDLLPGGSVYKLKAPWFDILDGYIQIVDGFEPQIMYADELAYSTYLPSSSQNYSMIPLEAIINKVAEALLFDKLMSEQADGTRFPEKLVVVTNNANPFSDFDRPEEGPLQVDEQKRLEEKLNEPRKGSVVTFSGNSATVVDLTKENTMAIQTERQKDIRNEVGLVFNGSSMEMNLGGSEQTSGRETSETQEEITMGRGITPIVKILEEHLSQDIIPFRFGYGYRVEYDKSKNEMDDTQLHVLQLQTGEKTVNELREEAGKDTFPDPQFDLPPNAQPSQPGQTPMQPLYTQGL